MLSKLSEEIPALQCIASTNMHTAYSTMHMEYHGYTLVDNIIIWVDLKSLYIKLLNSGVTV